ncbi:hypothetical protein OCU04_000212 [Sclerotinia nivalis]|uniref:Uncharacterized protein n=1 Tax=Sclerotinia nivalis TaxID=352851 RepID=A0A9X0DN67_9HELO|nr:hypothetical protein OCU04_000212 [Sclerotinia nivalis]
MRHNGNVKAALSKMSSSIPSALRNLCQELGSEPIKPIREQAYTCYIKQLLFVVKPKEQVEERHVEIAVGPSTLTTCNSSNHTTEGEATKLSLGAIERRWNGQVEEGVSRDSPPPGKEAASLTAPG